MQIFGVLLYYLPRGHIEMKHKKVFPLESMKCNIFRILFVYCKMSKNDFVLDIQLNYEWFLKTNRMLEVVDAGYITQANLNRILLKKSLICNFGCPDGHLFTFAFQMEWKANKCYKSHQTIKPSKVGFDKHLRMAFYDQRNERITCGNKVSVC